jgi:Circularly permutated YpsA SLOG family
VIEKVLTGGQAGADQGALRVARAAIIATGGDAPRGWMTEAGAAPWLGGYGLVECEIPGYPARTEANVRSCDAVLWFWDPTTLGGKLTLEWCHHAGARCGRRAVPGAVPAHQGAHGRGQPGESSLRDR